MKKWLEQHSPNGEMWYSWGFSVFFHVSAVVCIVLIAGRLFSRQTDYGYTVPIDIVFIEEEIEAEPEPEEEGFPELQEAVSVEEEQYKFEPITETNIGPEFEPFPETKPYEEPEKQVKALPAKKSRADRKLPDTSGSGGRGARWTLLIDKSDVGRYVHNLEKLGCTIAFPVGKGEMKYFSKPTNKPGPSRTGKKSEDNRLRWKQRSGRTAERVSEWMNLPKFQKMYWFMSESLESRLVELELKKAREVRSSATEDDLIHTHFKMTETNGQIEIECESVTFKERLNEKIER